MQHYTIYMRNRFNLAAALLAGVLACGGDEANSGSDTDLSPTGGPAVLQEPPHSQLPEICGNGIDDNQDGKIDEGCFCTVGSTQPCYPSGTFYPTRGICRPGIQRCIGSPEFAQWGPCEGAVLPQVEICGDGIDQDCDGQDEVCLNQQPEHPACGPANCVGCCTLDGTCRPGDTAMHCGSNGALCSTCNSPYCTTVMVFVEEPEPGAPPFRILGGTCDRLWGYREG